jgi:hypothetical protein
LQVDGLTTRQDTAQGEDLICGRAKDEAPHPGGVVADHTAKRRHVGGRSIRAKNKPMRLDHLIQNALHEARLDDAPPSFQVYFECITHLGYVQDEARRGSLSSEARAGPARRDREPGFASSRERLPYIILRTSSDNGLGLSQVDRSIG